MDLHIHSNISVDGTFSVEDILVKAQKEGVDVLSVTDHNSALAHVLLKHIDKQRYFKGKVIAGAEIDVVEDGVTFELLAYNFDVDPVQNWLYKKFATIDVRQTKIRDRLMNLAGQKGFKLSKNFAWDSKAEYAHHNVYRNLMQYKQNIKLFGMDIADGSEFYRNSTINKNFPLYMDMNFLWASVKEVVKIIHGSGGLVFLAHPYGYKKSMDVNKLLGICKKQGIDGIEVYHPANNNEQQAFLLDFSKKNKLQVSGGSDFHAREGEEILPFAKLKLNIKY